MAYYFYPFSPESYAAFLDSPRDVVGVRPRFRAAADKVQPGEMLVCYLTRLSRWAGLLEVDSGSHRDDAPLFRRENDPFVIRFKVKPLICLPAEQALPIHDHEVWRTLSFTHGQDKRAGRWKGRLHADLTRITEADGAYLVGKLCAQAADGKIYPLAGAGEQDKKPIPHAFPHAAKTAPVTVPRVHDRGHEADDSPPDKGEIRESRKMQALIAKVGEIGRAHV